MDGWIGNREEGYDAVGSSLSLPFFFLVLLHCRVLAVMIEKWIERQVAIIITTQPGTKDNKGEGWW